jgi:hypothetical protein
LHPLNTRRVYVGIQQRRSRFPQRRHNVSRKRNCCDARLCIGNTLKLRRNSRTVQNLSVQGQTNTLKKFPAQNVEQGTFVGKVHSVNVRKNGRYVHKPELGWVPPPRPFFVEIAPYETYDDLKRERI